jgi:hypothetical protein
MVNGLKTVLHHSPFTIYHLPHFFLIHCFVFERGAFVLRGDAIVLVRPVAEVDQFAAFGAKGTMRIIAPLDGLVAVRTLLHKTFRERGGGKGERQKQHQNSLALAFPLTFDHFPLP